MSCHGRCDFGKEGSGAGGRKPVEAPMKEVPQSDRGNAEKISGRSEGLRKRKLDAMVVVMEGLWR